MSLPPGWRIVTLGEIAHVYSGGTPSRAVASYWGGGIPWASTAEIDGTVISSTKERITEAGLAKSAAKVAPTGTLLMAMYGQGKTRGKTAMLGISAAMNQACAAIEPRAGIDSAYLLVYLQSRYEMIRGLSNAGSQENLSGQIVKKIPVVLPPLPEQVRIASAVRDVDSQIAELERVLAKKAAIRQGLMQQLLTGRTRLPGFVGAWSTRHIGDFANVRAGGTPSTAVDAYWGGRIPWMSSGEIHKRQVHSVRGRITPLGLEKSSAQLFPPGTVLMALAGQGKTRGTVAVSRIELTTNQSIAGIYPSNEHDPDYLYYNLETRYLELRGESAGDGGRGGLNLTIIKSIQLPIPGIDEQIAIARVLLDADAELHALERRLTKARTIKTGMMQQLLTGRVRLLVETAS